MRSFNPKNTFSGLFFAMIFFLFGSFPAQANVNLVIINETQNYQGIGADLTNGAKARLSRMGYIILNNSQKLAELGLTGDRFSRDKLLQRKSIRVTSDELIIFFLDTILSEDWFVDDMCQVGFGRCFRCRLPSFFQRILRSDIQNLVED